MSVAQALSKYALAFTFQHLPPDVIHYTKRFVLDTLGCAIGGYSSEASRIIQEVIKELGGPQEATVIGSGIKTSCLNAILANGAMVRYLDYNDAVAIKRGQTYRVGYHPSEVIPPILALGERQHLPGADVITAIVLGYELSYRFLDSIIGLEMEQRGWNGDTRGAYIMPLVAGKILGLTETQLENAVGISGSCHSVLGILDAASEEYTMTKNIRFPSMAYGGILAALLAQKGFTGPSNILEGQSGFIEVILKGDYDVKRLLDPGKEYAIRQSSIKSIIADYSAHSHLTATLTLVRKHSIKPEDITEVRIRTSTRCAHHTGDPLKKYPKNKETADHSSYYLTAIAIIDGQLGPNQFSPEKYTNPRVQQLIKKIVVEGDEQLDRAGMAGIAEITTRQGARYSCRVDYPKGHPLNPMTDAEIMDKFQSMARRYMSVAQIEQVISTIFELDKLDDIGKLNRLMIF
jgi:2-methylcitrate dehydratase